MQSSGRVFHLHCDLVGYNDTIMATNPLLQTTNNFGPVSGGAVAVTPSDSTVYDPPLRGLYINGSGTVGISFSDGSTFFGSPAIGVFHPLAGVSKVFASGTTASGIYGFRG